jgi:hypothetical protein
MQCHCKNQSFSGAGFKKRYSTVRISQEPEQRGDFSPLIHSMSIIIFQEHREFSTLEANGAFVAYDNSLTCMHMFNSDDWCPRGSD